ncbi:hypothetical protein G6F70_004247 [Rhizopus microsporus]|nr:hypothetical protein G6F71_004190 [Rhizopus microsporus]KAG1200200.1 hypothetical protein G6F70_004247 [Rhizopus microsporus]KAG1212185.1 hypothetical protein G6F69_003923 [Rhizopus microsporus]KAG1227958.1 hypothetical protein G6F67_008128 [Rhizopus microsporus]KAG1268388.1 hypothetical protein G6F68_001164 [Rhizopus microsporus]
MEQDTDSPATSPASSKRRSSVGSESKRKSPRACIPCRKRKVKCDGQSPCDRCVKANSACAFDKPPSKKESIKSTTESHTVKLKKLEQKLTQLSAVIDTEVPEPPLFPNSGPSKSEGHASYIPDSCLRIDRVPTAFNLDENMDIILKELQPKPEIYNSEPIQEHLLDIYFQYIDPLLPILHKPSFYHQVKSHQPVSSLLLNAIYCVSSRWDMSIPVREDEPRGWNYYQLATNLLNQQKEPQLTTVQALLLLLKYNEHVRRPGFVWRMRYYFQMIVRMCKDLGLQRDIMFNTSSPSVMIELEKRKRTFWAVYCYDVMMSIENGTPFHFNIKEYPIDNPYVLSDEANEHEKIMHFILLTKLMCCQAEIIDFLRRKLDPQFTVTNMITDWREEEAFNQLTGHLKTAIGMVTSITKFPTEDNMCYAVCFLYLAACFATISLHRPFAFQITDHSSPHTGHCTEAAFNIKHIIELILRCEAIEDMYCSIRGIQQVVHYLSAAVTVFREAGLEHEFNILLEITKKLAAISPVTELTASRETNDVFQDEPLGIYQKQRKKQITKYKHKSLELPMSTSDTALLTYNTTEQVHSQLLYHQMQSFGFHNNPLDQVMPNISSHQSLLGFLCTEDDMNDTSNNIPKT